MKINLDDRIVIEQVYARLVEEGIPVKEIVINSGFGGNLFHVFLLSISGNPRKPVVLDLDFSFCSSAEEAREVFFKRITGLKEKLNNRKSLATSAH
jgi:hypothetical protein